MDRENQIRRLLSNEALLPVQREVLKKYDRESDMNESITSSTRAGQLFKLIPLAVALKKPFEEMDREDIEEFLYGLEVGTGTLDQYKIHIKKFFKWLYKSELYPDAVKWLKVSNNKKRMLPDDILNPVEVKALMEAADNPRDRAFVSVLYESAARIEEMVIHEKIKNRKTQKEEIVPVKQKDLVFDQYGAVIILNGKTGMRRIRLIRSVPDLMIWMNHHPCKGDDQPLWVGLREPHEFLSLSRAAGLICSLGEKATIINARGEKEKLSKNVHPHLLRHTRLTEVAKFFKEADLKVFAGWSPDSKMASTYIHRSGADVEKTQLEAEGIITREEANKESDILKPRKCPRCMEVNPAAGRFCYKCGAALDLQVAIELEQKESNLLMEFMELVKREPKLLDVMKGLAAIGKA